MDVTNYCENATSTAKKFLNVSFGTHLSGNPYSYHLGDDVASYTAKFKIEHICGGSQVAFDFTSLVNESSNIFVLFFVGDELIELNQRTITKNDQKMRQRYGVFTHYESGSGSPQTLELTVKIIFPSLGMEGVDSPFFVQNFQSWIVTVDYMKI